MGLFGRKKKKPAETETGEAVLPALEFKPSAYPKNEAQGAVIAAKQLPGFANLVQWLAMALQQRADRILMDYTQQAVAVRFRIDGLWENQPPTDRPTGDSALSALKKLCGLNPAERRAKQTGKTGIYFEKTDWIAECVSQGVPTGERVLISLETKKPSLKTLSELGMRDKVIEQVKGELNGHGGIVIVSGPPGHGLPTTWRVVLEETDKFVRDFIALEDIKDPDPDIINVTKVTFDREKNETPEAVFERRLLKQPDAFIFPSLYNDAVVGLMLKQLPENRHAITRFVASDSVEALLGILQTHRAHAKELLKATRLVINQRLLRRLCPKCKQGFQPTPQLLAKLGLPADRVQKLYQPFVPPPPDQRVDAKGNPIEIEICTDCNGRGYRGRMALFEVLEVSDPLRKAILQNPNTDAVRKAAASLGHRGFQQEGILSVVLGLTSLQEVQRILQPAAK